MTEESISVLMSVYRGEKADHVNAAIESIVEQSVSPDEIVVVKDGPLTADLDRILLEWRSEHPSLFKFVELEKNQGLGVALREGIQQCSYDLIARMDSDDIAHPDRLKTQLDFLKTNPEADVVGGYVAEFEGSVSNVKRVRTVPSDPHKLAKWARFRCPMNHPTVMYRREAVLDSGNYRGLRSMQDYDLWGRMLLCEKVLCNIPEVLVYARAGEDLYRRRGGLEYVQIEYQLQRDFLDWGFVSIPVFAANVASRTAVRFMPNQIREWIYSKFLRSDE
ncbi:glycosyltransferase [Haladaptatus caseinilyticus]|uniref:glycosyltransferase n=1 Tax=Haladaptatus caseinilyticus TaxID=2993314 RepID=UPI00224B3417|nr:glycosyltransferase [Haladaptatus caseinilyticus]